MKKIAVVLSGCGVKDGSEIHEAVLTLLALDRAGLAYQCLAPDMDQHHVINHYTGEPSQEKRNVLIEAARIARGDIKPLETAAAEDYAAAIIPGGFGAALNLSNFALKGADCDVLDAVKNFVSGFIKEQKPVGFICIAPTMISKIYGPGVKLTVGGRSDALSAVEKMGAIHQECPSDSCVVDTPHKVVTTPAYMSAKSISEVADGIQKLVNEVKSLL